MIAVLLPFAATLAGILQPLMIVFVVVVLSFSAAFGLYTFFVPVQTPADRLEALTAASETPERIVDITGDRREQTIWEQIATRLGRLATNADEEGESEERQHLRKILKIAGYRNRRAPEIYDGIRVAATMLIPVAVSPLGFVMDSAATAFAMLIGAAAGYYAPGMILQGRADERKAELLRTFPDALDLLVSSVEAGLSIDQAFKRVAVEMVTVAPALAKEFTLVNSEIAAGVDRLTAMKHLDERTGLDEIRSLVNMMAQSERFGSSISESLRLYSDVAREKRVARAEEAAGQVGSKLTIVMILFFLPVLMIILLVPSVIRAFGTTGG